MISDLFVSTGFLLVSEEILQQSFGLGAFRKGIGFRQIHF